jgi:predicted secreted hydrolase
MRRAPLAWAFAALVCGLAAGAVPPAEPDAVFGGAAPGFAQALSSRPFVFPADHGPHPQFRQEWWYLTGNLDGAGGERFGFELTFFRYALAPPGAGSTGAAPQAASAWRAREIYLAHFAITDVAAQRFRFAEKLSRAALGLAGAQAVPLRVWIDDWALDDAGSGVEVSTPAGAAPSAAWKLRAAQADYALELEVQPLTPPVLNGEAGLSRKSADSASYYYSIPRLAVHGRLLRSGQPLAVRGLAWFDREWGSGELAASQAGWDWFGLQLTDGTALMFYALRARDGNRDPHSAGTWMESSGEARPLTSAAVDTEVTDRWSSTDGVRYPSGWRIRVPSLALDLTVHPVLADQELKTRPRYWEGAVDVSGARQGRPLRGRGYVELVGYAHGTGSAAGQ